MKMLVKNFKIQKHFTQKIIKQNVISDYVGSDF